MCKVCSLVEAMVEAMVEACRAPALSQQKCSLLLTTFERCFVMRFKVR